MERRSLLDRSMASRRDNPDVFADEYEVDELDGAVADGFRPSGHDRDGAGGSGGGSSVGSSVRSSHAGDDEGARDPPPARTLSAHYASHPASPAASALPSRNSTRKSRSAAGDNPFASPEDVEDRAPSLVFESDFAGHRRVSSGSSQGFARSSSPRFGTGPSHPYGMYPQGTLPRSPSIATQSTVRPSHRHSSSLRQNGPQHPYALYPQGVSEDMDDAAADDGPEHATPPNPVPVGFPGLGQSYQRRLGPDGEEQDIIGEDGHTEQLPPYSRYPEDAPEKMPLLVPQAPAALHSRVPVAGTDPTMPLMHTPLQPSPTPRPQSMADESQLRDRPSSMAGQARAADNAPEDGDSTLSKKTWSQKSWKEKRKTKFCGIPFWWILLAIGVLTFIAAVLGSVLGAFFNHVKHNKGDLNLAGTSLYDASAIATPATASPATGTFALSLSTPQEVYSSCLTESDQDPAWSCDLAGPAGEAIVVGTPPDDNDQLGAFLFYANPNQRICYGSQPAFMETTFAPFMTVQDNDDRESGPAYYFSQFYDKLVVVPENALSAPSGSNSKRQIQLDQSWLQQKQVAQAGDKPWFCVWNNTFVEGFIYVQRPVTTYTTTSAPTSAPTSTLQSSGTTATGLTSSTPTITTTVTFPSATATFTGPPEGLSYWSSHQAARASAGHGYDGDGDDGHGDGDDATSTGSKHRRHAKRQVNSIYNTLAMYPYVVKIEERRLPGNTVPPYCQQYQILDDGNYNWVADDNGKPITITLEEQDPAYAAYESAGLTGKSKRQNPQVGGCHCQWLSGQSGGMP